MNNLNYYTIKISGLNLHYVLNFFEREKINATKIKRQNQKCLICTLSHDEYKYFINQSLSKAYKISIIKEKGINKFFKFTALHLGIILGICLCTFSFFIYTTKIQKVVINTQNHDCQNQEMCIFKGEQYSHLLEFLAYYGIEAGRSLPLKTSLREIENQLILEFEQISGATIKIKGIFVYVDIVEAQLPENETSKDLIAPVSGIIVSNFVTSGKSLVKNGDIVVKGQTLAKMVDNNKIVATFEIRTFYHESLIYDRNQITYVKTGKTATSNNVSLFGTKFISNNKPNYQYYQTKVKTSYGFLNMFLPIKIQSTTYFELSAITEDKPFEDVQENLKQELYQKTVILLDKNATKRNTTYATITEGSRTRLDCYIEAIYTITL